MVLRNYFLFPSFPQFVLIVSFCYFFFNMQSEIERKKKTQKCSVCWS